MRLRLSAASAIAAAAAITTPAAVTAAARTAVAATVGRARLGGSEITELLAHLGVECVLEGDVFATAVAVRRRSGIARATAAAVATPRELLADGRQRHLAV